MGMHVFCNQTLWDDNRTLNFQSNNFTKHKQAAFTIGLGIIYCIVLFCFVSTHYFKFMYRRRW